MKKQLLEREIKEEVLDINITKNLLRDIKKEISNKKEASIFAGAVQRNKENIDRLLKDTEFQHITVTLEVLAKE